MTNFKRFAPFLLAAVLIPALHTESRCNRCSVGAEAQVRQAQRDDDSSTRLLADLSNLRILRIGSQALAGMLGEDILMHFEVLLENHNRGLSLDASNTPGSRREIAQ
jgi:hypothetical protein